MPACSSCDCKDAKLNHYLVRCGCPNDRAPGDPMYKMDDAFHRSWCSECLVFCCEPRACPMVISKNLGYFQNISPWVTKPLSSLFTLVLTLARLCTSFYAIEVWRRN